MKIGVLDYITIKQDRKIPAIDAEIVNHVLVISLQFQSNVKYCCFEPGCFIPVQSAKFWNDVNMEIQSLGATWDWKIKICGKVDAGAMTKIGGIELHHFEYEDVYTRP